MWKQVLFDFYLKECINPTRQPLARQPFCMSPCHAFFLCDLFFLSSDAVLVTHAPILGCIFCLAAFPWGGSRTSGSPAAQGKGSPTAPWSRWKSSRSTTEAGRKDNLLISLRVVIKSSEARFTLLVGVGFFDQLRESRSSSYRFPIVFP